MQINLAVEPRAEDVRPHIPGRARIVDGLLQRRKEVLELATNVDIGRVRLNGIAADQRAFHQQMGIALHQHVVLERTRLALVGIAHDVLGLRRLLVDELPLHARREARTAASAQARLLHFVDHLIGSEGQGLAQPLVALLVRQVVLEGVAARCEDVLGEHGLIVGIGLRPAGRGGASLRGRRGLALDVEMAA